MSNLILLAILAGVVMAFVLYRTALLRKELRTELLEPSEEGKAAAELAVEEREPIIRQKLKKVLVGHEESEKAAEQLSKIVREEAEVLLHDIKQEYSVKYQVVVQEKTREVEHMKKQF